LPSRLRSDAAALLSPGRQFLRDYLLSNWYLKEAQALDDKMEKLSSDPEETKSSRTDSKKGLNIFNKPPPASGPTVAAATPATPSKPQPTKPKKDGDKTTTQTSTDPTDPLSLVDSKAPAWKPLITLRSHLDGVRSVAFHPTEPILLSASEDGTAKFWNLSEPLKNKKKKVKSNEIHLEPSYTYLGHRGMVTTVACKADNKSNLAFTAGVDGNVIVWRLPTSKQDAYAEFGKCAYFRQSVFKHGDAVWGIAVHPTSNLIFSVSADGKVSGWQTEENGPTTPRYAMEHKDAKTNVLAIPTSIAMMAQDNSKLLVGYSNGDLCVVDAETAKTVNTILPSEAESGELAWPANSSKQINCIASGPSLANLVLTASVDQCVRYYDVTQSRCQHVMRAHRDTVTSVSLDPNGQFFVSSSHDQGMRFWDVNTRKIVQDLDPHQTHQKKFDESVHCVVYHPSQSVLASGGADSVIKIYS